MATPLLSLRSAPTARLAAAAVVVGLAGCAHSSRGSSRDGETAVGVGYGTQAEDEVTGSVESADAGELETVKVGRFEELLQGRFAGVQVLRTPDGGFSVRIRGGSQTRRSEPLYVIDGVPIRVSAGQGITWINPADVARIDVLKDAAAAIYGWNAADGVVLITTRR